MNLSQPYYIEPRTGERHLDLNGQWDYAYTDHPWNPGSEEPAWNLTTQVPNSLFWSLFESGVLPHPYEACNSKQYHWVDEKIWYYRKTFRLTGELRLGDAFLCLDGAAYHTRLWLNGQLLGEHEGMFGGPFVEVDSLLNYSGDNTLIVEIKSCNYGKKDSWDSWNRDGGNRVIVPWNLARDKRTSNGDFIIMGLWRGVRIEFLPKLHLSRPYLYTESLADGCARLRFKCEIADGTVNELTVRQDYDSGSYEYTRAFDNGITGLKQSEPVAVRIELREKTSGRLVSQTEDTVNLYDYEQSGIDSRFYECQFYNRTLTVNDPVLWYPHHLGDPFLYTATVSLLQDNKVKDIQTFDFGIRTIALEETTGEQYRARWDKFQLVVNGRRVFLKGMNWMPVDFLLKLPREEYRWALELARNAGIQLLRVWSGGGIPEADDFYELCDELGIMVWQDSFIANMETPNWPQDILQAQVNMYLYRIRNHPSLAMHCGGNEFNPYAFGNAASMFVIERNVADLDPSRPFMRTTSDKGSAHVYRDMEPVWYRRLYKELPFLAESGIHSFPNAKSLRQLLTPGEFNRPLTDMMSPEFRQSHPELLNHFTEYVPDRVPRMLARASAINDVQGATLEELAEASQLASCEFYQIMIQSMRENYPVTAGVIPWVFKRAWTTIGIQLVDGLADPIAPYYYVKSAYQPLTVMACLNELVYAPSEQMELPLMIIQENCSGLEQGVELVAQIWSPLLELAYEYRTAVDMPAGQYRSIHTAEPFTIPEEYAEAFFLVRTALVKHGRIIAQSVYWPKCLSRMTDPEFRSQRRSKPEPNLFFDKGPWFKPQLQSAPKAALECSIVSVHRQSTRVTVRLELANPSLHPAFPVCVNVEDDGTVCRLNDNYYFHNPGEKKELELEVLLRNPQLESLRLVVSAWNAPPFRHRILFTQI
ncbi:MAG: beta-mannosidase [Paenibacillaceae bacterium]|nr:beta-mannosidase [Paenibacillaceae bacterium]